MTRHENREKKRRKLYNCLIMIDQPLWVKSKENCQGKRMNTKVLCFLSLLPNHRTAIESIFWRIVEIWWRNSCHLLLKSISLENSLDIFCWCLDLKLMNIITSYNNHMGTINNIYVHKNRYIYCIQIIIVIEIRYLYNWFDN